MTTVTVTGTVTVCPPGKAIGADDLHNWALRRTAGRSGVRMTQKEREQFAKKSESRDDYLDGVTDKWLAEAERRARSK